MEGFVLRNLGGHQKNAPRESAPPGVEEAAIDRGRFPIWQREQERNYSGPGEANFYYEGFDQYGFHGESTFGVGGNGDGLDGTLDDEELMRRHLRMLEILGLLSGEAGE